ncbi:MAG: UPF0182 family protein, partial [Vicinamibacterales bacterium]|nr:UPF0182 family protein [Vicinamibacterales bacterium]
MSIRTLIIVAVVLLFLIVPAFAGFYTNWIWFDQVGFNQVFIEKLVSQVILGSAVFVIAFSLLLGGLRFALREMTKPYLLGGGVPEIQPHLPQAVRSVDHPRQCRPHQPHPGQRAAPRCAELIVPSSLL